MGKLAIDRAYAEVGKKFGRLTIEEITDKRTIERHIIVRCSCECGNEYYGSLRLLRNGHVKSCGCLMKDPATKEASTKRILQATQDMFTSGQWAVDPKIGSAKRVYANGYNDGDLTFEDFLILSQRDCFYCGAPPSNYRNAYTKYRKSGPTYSAQRIADGYFTYNGLDRVDNSRPHDLDNLVPCCWDCNAAKLKRTKEEFLQWIKNIYDKHFL